MRARRHAPLSPYSVTSPSESQVLGARTGSGALLPGPSVFGTGSGFFCFQEIETYATGGRRNFFKKKNKNDQNLGSKVDIYLK